MKENQRDKNLQDYRNEIDRIDDQIISLLEARMQIVLQVADFKKSQGERFFIKSAREVDMIKDLIKKANNFPASVIAGIWRKIITSANMSEQPIRVIIHNPKNVGDYKYLVREYFSEIVPITELHSASSVALEIEKNHEQIAAFTSPNNFSTDEENWWINIANNKMGLRIFAKTPLVKFVKNDEENKTELFLAAIKEPEKSQSDSSLLVIEFNDKLSQKDLLDLLKKYGFKAKILKSAKVKQFSGVTFNLVEVDGFYLEEDSALTSLKNDKTSPFVKVLGHFANQIEVSS